MKIGFVGALALLASCASASKLATSPGASTGGSAPPTMASDRAPGVAAGPAAVAGNKGATIATEGARAPAPGQLTAGVWDDNLNFDFFVAYANRMAQSSSDLAAFRHDDQKGTHDALAQRQLARRTELDVQLVLDTTGSMGDELQYLQSEFLEIAKLVHAKFPNVTPRWSLVLYRDQGDAYLTRPFDFTTDAQQFRKDLAAQSAGGGGDFPEAVIAGLDRGLGQRWRQDDGVAKIMFWVADAPPHPGEGRQLAELARRARDLGVHIYPIASSGIDDGTEYQMRATAQLTGGRYLFLTDDSQVGNSHAEPHIPCYAVTRLDHAVVRMIESELVGDRAPVAPDQVVRRVGAPDADGRCAVHETQVVAF